MGAAPRHLRAGNGSSPTETSSLTPMQIAPYADEYFDDVHRQWVEVGWIDRGSDSDKETQRIWMSVGHGSVAIVDEHAEAFGHWTPGTVWYVDRPVTLCAVTAITTSRVARRQGLASALTARALKEGKEAGMTIAGLGIFDQGYYDRFGFGTSAQN